MTRHLRLDLIEGSEILMITDPITGAVSWRLALPCRQGRWVALLPYESVRVSEAADV